MTGRKSLGSAPKRLARTWFSSPSAENMSWVEYGGRNAPKSTKMASEWARFKDRNPDAKLVLIDLQPYGSTQVDDDEDVLNVGGFSDRVFEIVELFSKRELESKHWVDVIRATELS